jgi:hypothetical protein
MTAWGTSTAFPLTRSYQSIKSVRDFKKMLDAPSVGLLDELHQLSDWNLQKLEFWRNAVTTHHAFVNKTLLAF